MSFAMTKNISKMWKFFFKLQFRKYLENIEINLHLDFATCSVRLTILRTSSTSVAYIQSGC